MVPVMREAQEIEDEEHEQVLERVAAVDVAKATGMVCTRVPHPASPGKRRTRVWEVDVTTRAILELGEHLAGEGIEKVTLESTPITCESGSTCWRRLAWTCSWSTPGM
jgi:transposase